MTFPHHSEAIVGKQVEEKEDGRVVDEKILGHVLGGYKATIHSPRSSDAAKQHAADRIKELEGEHHKDRKHVVAGMKAAIHNEHVHDDVKVYLRDRLDKMGEPLD